MITINCSVQRNVTFHNTPLSLNSYNMDGPSAKKSTSFETLVIQNIENVNDLKAKLNEIIAFGQDYEYDVSSCLKTLLKSSDQTIVLLTVQAISELAKCELKRESYAQKEIIEPILSILNKEITIEKIELTKQSCRALGNLCFDCNTSRKLLLENKGVEILRKVLEFSTKDIMPLSEIKLLTCKTLLNYAIGGLEYSESLIKGDVIDCAKQILCTESGKDCMEDDLVSTAILILSVINDNNAEFVFDPQVNLAVLNVLRETANIEVSELCLEHLHTQAEHDSVKTLLAKEGGVNLVCHRLEQLMQRTDLGDMNTEDSEIMGVMKQACDLVIIVLTGDEAMNILYNNGVGEVYLTMVKWLESTNYQLLATGILAIGNFARQDDYCTQMMEDNIFDKLLDIFELYHGFSVRMEKNENQIHPIDKSTIIKIQHASLSALRNLTVPPSNKRIAAAKGRAAPILINALPNVEDHHVAYKLLAALRMLVDGQEGVARQVALRGGALRGAARWGRAEHAGAAGEAPRLLAWTARLLAGDCLASIVEVEGCVSSLVNMLVASHSVMQNEAILALTLLSIHDKQTDKLTSQLLSSEIGKHISVLIETNCAKMPVEVAENLVAFLDITCKNNTLVCDYKETKVNDALQKFSDSRSDLSNELKICIDNIIAVINGKAV